MSSIFEYIQLGVYRHGNDVVDLVERGPSQGLNGTRAPQIWAFTFFGLLIVTPFVAARFYVRCNSGIKTVGFDDFMILLALIAQLACGAVAIWGTSLGFGKHVWHIVNQSADTLYNLQIVVILLPTIYQFSLACVQLSILTFYIRFFAHLRRAAFVMMAIVVTFCCTAIAGNVFHCRPKPEFPVNICKQLAVLGYFSSSISLLLDIIIWLLPLPKLLKLKSLSRRRKIGIIATFGVGASAIIVSTSRLIVFGLGASNEDKYWGMARMHIYNLIELGFGIACACMPSLMPLLRRFLIWKRGRDSGQRRNNAHPDPNDLAIVLKNDVLDSTYVENDSRLPASMMASSRDEHSVCITVADIRGCGILDSPMAPENCLSRGTIQDQGAVQQTQHMRRVGDWIELAPMTSIAESMQVPCDGNPENINLPQQPPSAEIPNKRISIGSVPGARIMRRASNQFRGLLRPFSFERSRELWNSAPAGPGSESLRHNSDATDQFSKSAPNHTPASVVTGRPLATSYSGEMMLLVGGSNQQQQQHNNDADVDVPEPHHYYQSNYSSSSSSMDTITTDIQYLGASTLHSRTPEGVHTTPLSPRTSQLRETPWRDTIYPNPVEDQRGMLGLGDVDPVAGCILQIERVDTMDSQFMQRG